MKAFPLANFSFKNLTINPTTETKDIIRKKRRMIREKEKSSSSLYRLYNVKFVPRWRV